MASDDVTEHVLSVLGLSDDEKGLLQDKGAMDVEEIVNTLGENILTLKNSFPPKMRVKMALFVRWHDRFRRRNGKKPDLVRDFTEEVFQVESKRQENLVAHSRTSMISSPDSSESSNKTGSAANGQADSAENSPPSASSSIKSSSGEMSHRRDSPLVDSDVAIHASLVACSVTSVPAAGEETSTRSDSLIGKTFVFGNDDDDPISPMQSVCNDEETTVNSFGKESAPRSSVLDRGTKRPRQEADPYSSDDGTSSSESTEDEMEDEEIETVLRNFSISSGGKHAVESSREQDEEDAAVESEIEQATNCAGHKIQTGQCYYHTDAKTNSSTQIYGVVLLRETRKHRVRANCVEIVPVGETYLRRHADDLPYCYFRLDREYKISIDALGDQPPDLVDGLPEMVYVEPPANDLCKGYVIKSVAREGRQSTHRVHGSPRLLELFGGAGGMHLGFKEAGFETARVVDSNPDAIHTITDSIPVPVSTQDVRRLLQNCSQKDSEMRTLLEPIHHIHSSSPCGGSSTLNRVGGAKAKKANELSGVLIEFVQLFEPFTATFENVPGILREKNRSYLIGIIVSLLKFGYQVR